jgi:hypothetical protein
MLLPSQLSPKLGMFGMSADREGESGGRNETVCGTRMDGSRLRVSAFSDSLETLFGPSFSSPIRSLF